VKLMTESLVASYRLSPNKVLNTLLPEFLKPDAPHHFKIALVNAFLRITIEGEKLKDISGNHFIRTCESMVAYS
jgi:hypothetical protein